MSFEVKKVGREFRRWWVMDVGRFWFALTHLFDKYDGAMARDDITHAYVNVYVELIRTSAYLIGHLLAIFVPWLLIALVWK